MKQERGAESLFFQQASEAILKQSHEEAFTFLEKGLAIARGGGKWGQACDLRFFHKTRRRKSQA